MEGIINEIIFSSSSSSSSSSDVSSDGEDMLQLQNILFVRGNPHRVPNFIDDIVGNYTEDEFRRNFRVHQKTAAKITNQFKNSTHFKKSIGGGRQAISAEAQCLSFLWFSGNKDSYTEVSNLFNVSLSSAYTNLTNFLEFLYEISTEHIRFPSSPAEKNENCKRFSEIAGFENVLGCIDGCYIYIRKPANKIRSTYVNRHGLLSITLQGICDADKKFLDVYIGSPSKIHDSRIYKLSFISKEIPSLCGQQYHILGDAAYPLRQYLLTPYRDYGNLTIRQKMFNKKHCQTRVKIENCFGLLKQRFRQLTRLDFFTVERMSKFVLGCCVLHNLCITEGDLWEDIEFLEETIPAERQTGFNNTERECLTEAVLQHLGQIKRNNIAEAL